MSDSKSSSTRFQNRRALVDRENALSGARNPGESKYGNALFRGNGVENRLHHAEINRIEKQLKRNNMHIEQTKKQFVQRYTMKEPMLIVVRPPSPGPISKLEDDMYNIENEYEYGDPMYKGGKRYMEPLKAKTNKPNYRPTIDAFCLQTKKKVNVWEHVMLEKELPKFRSTVMPSYPLTTIEIKELQRGMEYHKLSLEASSKERISHKFQQKKKKKKITPALPSSLLPENPDESPDEDVTKQWHFVTEGAPNDRASVQSPADSNKSLTSEDTKTYPRRPSLKHQNTRKPSVISILEKQSETNPNAICMVYGEPNQKLSNEETDTFTETDGISDSGAHVQVTSPTPDMTLDDDSEDVRKTKVNNYASHQRDNNDKMTPPRKSGLEVILETSMEGMNGAESHG